jgi:hypothetical protein
MYETARTIKKRL